MAQFGDKNTKHKEMPLTPGYALCGTKIKRIPVGYVSWREVPYLRMDIRQVTCSECKRLFKQLMAKKG